MKYNFWSFYVGQYCLLQFGLFNCRNFILYAIEDRVDGEHRVTDCLDVKRSNQI